LERGKSKKKKEAEVIITTNKALQTLNMHAILDIKGK
jgi:hypothetical protein